MGIPCRETWIKHTNSSFLAATVFPLFSALINSNSKRALHPKTEKKLAPLISALVISNSKRALHPKAALIILEINKNEKSLYLFYFIQEFFFRFHQLLFVCKKIEF